MTEHDETILSHLASRAEALKLEILVGEPEPCDYRRHSESVSFGAPWHYLPPVQALFKSDLLDLQRRAIAFLEAANLAEWNAVTMCLWTEKGDTWYRASVSVRLYLMKEEEEVRHLPRTGGASENNKMPLFV